MELDIATQRSIMGVKGLFSLIKKYAPGAVKVYTHKRGAPRIGVDANILLNQLWNIGVTRRIVSRDGRPIHHLQGFLYRVINSLEMGLTPIFVFDGKPPAYKQRRIERARREESGATHTYIPKIPHEAYAEVKLLLDLLGVERVDAKGEADEILPSIGLVSSEDSDLLVRGADLLRGGTKNPQVIRYRDLLSHLGLTPERFITLAVLLGTDYNARILPPVKALAAAREGKQLSFYTADPAALAAEKIFLSAVGHGTMAVATNPPIHPANLDEAKKFLIERGVDPLRVTNAIKRLSALRTSAQSQSRQRRRVSRASV